MFGYIKMVTENKRLKKKNEELRRENASLSHHLWLLDKDFKVLDNANKKLKAHLAETNASKHDRIAIGKKATTNKKVYLAGAITNRLDTYKQVFAEKKKELEQQGHIVLSPHKLPDGLKWKEYMKITRAKLLCCDTIYVLKDWEQSVGTKLEIMLASENGIRIIFEEEIERYSKYKQDK